jgi:LysM repeat protein
MTHIVKAGETLSQIARRYNISLDKLLAVNSQYKADPAKIFVGDKLIIPEPASANSSSTNSTNTNSSNSYSSNSSTRQVNEVESAGVDDPFIVASGQLTFDAEGMETEGPYFSRKPHVPGSTSGVTIGRGYDMKERSQHEVVEDLCAAGVPVDTATQLSQCRGLSGAQAENFLDDKGYEEITISPAQQKKLFSQVYQELAGDVLRICRKPDVVAKYGTTQWEQLDPIICDVVVDLRYRGDYTGSTRERVQPLIVDNDVTGLQQLMADKHYWVGSRNVPVDRFRRRRDYFVKA